MWLVLCEANDEPALWACQGLKKRGFAPLEVITAKMLAQGGVRWAHRLGADGASIEISLAKGHTIRGDAVRGVLNRLVTAPSAHLHKASAEDRNYAGQELAAFFLSWLYALPQPVLNRPTSQGLSGRWRHFSEWVWLASAAGLPTMVYKQTSHDHIDRLDDRRPSSSPPKTVILVEEHAFGAAAPPEVIRSCRHLAELAGTALLGVEFADAAEGPWTFAGATPLPDLRLGGQALLDALATVLQRRTTADA